MPTILALISSIGGAKIFPRTIETVRPFQRSFADSSVVGSTAGVARLFARFRKDIDCRAKQLAKTRH